MYQEDHHSKAKTIWLVIIILFIGISNTVWGLLYFKQLDTDKQADAKLSTLTQTNANLDKEVTELKAKVKDSAPAIDEATNWREIPELGVKIKATDATNTLTWTYVLDGQARKTLLISSAKLTETGSGLSVDKTNPDFRISHTCSSVDATAVILVSPTKPLLEEGGENAKKIGDNYFSYYTGKPTAKCDQTEVTSTVKAVKEAFDSLELIAE